MDTLAVVVSYNDWQNTMATVESLLAHARVVVWDNASTDGTVNRLRGRFPNLEIHAHDHNVLWTPACNMAIRRSLGDEDYLLVSNNDIIYRPNVLDRLKAALHRPDVGIVGPTGSALGGLQDFETHWRRPGRATAANVDHLPTVRTNFVVGAAMMLRTELWHELGPFDASMPLGADDHDYCLRAKDAGYQIQVVNSAYVNHKGHASGRHAKAVWDEWGGKSWAAFNEKWVGYFYNELEAVRCHWNPAYTPGWDYGTGWFTEEARAVVWKARGASYEDPL
jgi:GT2 family glycosyltransferase